MSATAPKPFEMHGINQKMDRPDFDHQDAKLAGFGEFSFELPSHIPARAEYNFNQANRSYPNAPSRREIERAMAPNCAPNTFDSPVGTMTDADLIIALWYVRYTREGRLGGNLRRIFDIVDSTSADKLRELEFVIGEKLYE